MSNETVRDVLMDIGKSAVGVSIAKAMDIPKMLDMGNSFAMQHGSNGVLYAGISDVINYASGGPSKLMSFDIRGLIDDALYLGVISGATELAKLDETFYSSIVNAGVGRATAEVLVESAVVTTGRFGMRFIDESPVVPDILKAIRRPTRLISM